MYNYEEEKKYVFTDEGQRRFLQIRDRAKNLIDFSGSASAGKIIQNFTGISWKNMACVDRLVEIGELVEVRHSKKVAFQSRVFIAAANR